ncbi:MAG: hypothetical protein R3E89_12975 [Thiolinea sp.]
MREHEDPLLAELIRKLHASDGFEAAFEVYQQTVMDLGYEGVLYGYAPALYGENDPLFKTPVFRASGLYSQTFMNHYCEAGYDRYDYTIKAILEGKMEVLDWWRAIYHNQLLPNEVKVLQVAQHLWAKKWPDSAFDEKPAGYFRHQRGQP